jgi:hypothetical protein
VENGKIEIADLCMELDKLARSSSFSQHTAQACTQASLLLRQLRELIISAPGLPNPEGDAVSKLKWILAQQGEG